jgi:hypothetical protein
VSVPPEHTDHTAAAPVRGGVAHEPWFTHGVTGIGIASFRADLGHEVPEHELQLWLVPGGNVIA